jgi:hypothetical protein
MMQLLQRLRVVFTGKFGEGNNRVFVPFPYIKRSKEVIACLNL